MKSLTQNEIKTFYRILDENTQPLKQLLNREMRVINEIRNMEMTEETLALLEFATEKRCKVYMVNKTWENLRKTGAFDSPNDALCDYVREVIKLFTNLGDKTCVN